MNEVVTVTWHKRFYNPEMFSAEFGSCQGFYLVNDAEYEGSVPFRQSLINEQEFLYLGQTGGGADRSVKESKTASKPGSKYIPSTYAARYRPGSYTNWPLAYGSGRNMKWPDGTIIHRPIYFGEVNSQHRKHIRAIESQIIGLYVANETKFNYQMINKDKKVVLLPQGTTAVHTGDVPFLLV